MDIEISKVSQRIKSLREQNKFTQEALAKELGVSRQSVIALEQGRCLPSLPLALELSRVFDETLEFIFCNIENKIISREVNMPRELMPWMPMRELSSLHDTIDSLFEESLPVVARANIAVPLINVYEKDNNVVVEAEMPGVKEEDLSIEVGEDQLTIRGEKKTEEEVKEKNFYRKETSYGSFSRTIALPAGINKDAAEAELKDGILTVTLPKMEEPEKKVTKVKIKKA